MRLGIIGLDSSRPLRVARHLRGLASSGHTLDLIVDEGDAMIPGLRDLAPTADIVSTPHEATGLVDAVFDLGRRAAARRERLVPLLNEGVHAFVDKPLALTRDDAGALIEAARAGGAALMSDSGYRLAVSPADAPDGGAIDVSGPADPSSPWGGLAFYGMHHAQIAHTLRGDAARWELTDVADRGRSIVARIETPTGVIRLVFDADATGFSLGTEGVDRSITPPEDYFEQLVDRFLASCEEPEHDDAWAAQLSEPVALMQDIVERISPR